MLYFERSKTTILFESRVVEYLLYLILDHLFQTEIDDLDKAISKKIFTVAVASFMSKEHIYKVLKHLGEEVSYSYSIQPIEYRIFGYIKKQNFLNFSHFLHNFDAESFIKNKMNQIYWSYVDKNLSSTIKYRKRRGIGYDKKIKTISNSLKNIMAVDSMSFLLFIRYRESMEPYFLLHSIINNITPVVTVKYYISDTPRACTFGDKCRNGFVFIGCNMISEQQNFYVDYCFCSKHLKILKNDNYKLNICGRSMGKR